MKKTAAQRHKDLTEKIEEALGGKVNCVRDLKNGKIRFHLHTSLGSPPGTVHFVELDPITNTVQFFDKQCRGFMSERVVLLGSSPFNLIKTFLYAYEKWVRRAQEFVNN